MSASNVSSQLPFDAQSSGQGASSQPRTVVRAACLNCRSAKRRCDGVAPVCGPCSSRGIEAGGCNFVSSKRGGPRYKGVKGAEAAKVKAVKDRAREASRTSRSKKGEIKAGQSPGRLPSDLDSTNSQRSASPLAPAPDSRASFSSGWKQGSNGSKRSPGAGSSHSQSQSAHSPFSPSWGSVQASNVASTANYGNTSAINSQSGHQRVYQQPYYQEPQGLMMQPSMQPSTFDGDAGLPWEDMSDSILGGPLSFANLELWQRIQEGATEEDLAAFTDFYSRLEMLPKAGLTGGETSFYGDPLDVLMDWEGGQTGNNLQDNEQGVRTLLSDYYEHVYPSCPVLLPLGNLPSLAFYFSGKGPCGLFASISAVVCLYLPPQEAVKTLKNSQAAMARLGGSPSNDPSTPSVPTDRVMSTSEIAAYHAKTAEFILHQYAEAKATCFFDASCPNPFDGMDEELITIEAAAAHTLLCHYYYGSGQPLSHQRAFKHAVEAWDLVQKLDLRAKSSYWENNRVEGVDQPNSTRPFSSDLKMEWAKRVYWVSYSGATVMSCTGGFKPFGNPRDEAMELKLRPHLEHDVAAWGVMVRGAQQVSRTYRLLYELEQLRVRLATRGAEMDQGELHQAAVERQTIFNEMLKLDGEIGTYTRFDPSWRWMSTETESTGMGDAEETEKQLAWSLKTSGRLMTSGAIIILHRAQAFSNARVFMQPQCGIPEAVRAHKFVKHDALLHRAAEDERHSDGGNVIAMAGMQITNQATPSSNESLLARDAVMSTNPSWTGQAMAQHHPFLTDRFAGGPFEPAHALERCRFAASTMINTLPGILAQHGAPKLPPHSACSFVLGAYATLMLTLLMQVHGEEAELQARGGITQTMETSTALTRGGPNPSAGQSLASASVREELKRQLTMHRAPVRDIIAVLNRFASVWNKAVEYEEEVSMLLAANEIIG